MNEPLFCEYCGHEKSKHDSNGNCSAPAVKAEDYGDVCGCGGKPKTVFCKNCPHAGFLHPTPFCSNFEPLES